MKEQIKVIVKRPGEKYGHIAYIDNKLKAFQHLVGGYIETISVDDLVIVCNEEGKLRSLMPNLIVNGDMVVGTIVVCGVDAGEFTDCPVEMNEWRKMIDPYKVVWKGEPKTNGI